MKTNIFVILILLPLFINGQNSQLSLFDNLVGKTWEADGNWEDGSIFKQEIEFKYSLEGTIVVASSKGFINKEQTKIGLRNHGIKRFDKEAGQIKFWEFDVFGGLTEGEVSSQGKNIVYTYDYGDSVVTDMWEYVNDSTYNFKVGDYNDGNWKQIYLSTQFNVVKKQQVAPKINQVSGLFSEHQVISNIEYLNIDGKSLELDLYVPAIRLGGPPWIKYSEDKKPTLLFLHGGGWTSGDKISRSLFLMPFVQQGWCVVTANYRLLDQTDLAGCISDSRSALNWIYDNSDKYKFDTSKIIVSGESAGGHLALMTGLISEDLDFQMPKTGKILSVAGIVNWFGVTDIYIDSKNWDEDRIRQVTGNAANSEKYLKMCSPISYLTQNSVPILSIHGDLDVSAHYEQSVLLHKKLNEMGLRNEFLTIEGKKHGNFNKAEMTMAFNKIWEFTQALGIN
ncbi:acetyl esterase/lipase [Saonia flava]|uniref:Acetyl esterase/lipase n=1 Tax=Saonia flava TaxID=523696 RepID=A0A846QSN2_9FLAO|nr:alpha/beta hydrolase [Saonia flava]NJB69542.1 acetyl esterase/lipase [Saonia flava]